jgi:hypothetical protein
LFFFFIILFVFFVFFVVDVGGGGGGGGGGEGLFRLLVVGNPGVGKSVLSFLFMRVLLELGTKVFLSFFFFLTFL